MRAFVDEHPEVSDEFVRLTAVSQDVEFLQHHFATCPGGCQPWMATTGRDLHPPFRRALAALINPS
jgi:hypothetical protein